MKTANVKGQSGQIYFTTPIMRNKEGLMKINDFLCSNKIPEPYLDYFEDNGIILTVSAYTSDMQPTDNEKIQWNNLFLTTTDQPLANNFS